MFGDELAYGTLRWKEACAFGFNPHQRSIRSRTPGILHIHAFIVGTGFDAMRHCDARIILIERKPRDGGNKVFRDQLPNEDYAPLGGPPDIETKIHLLKGLVKRDW